jgi:copper homeostasis protein
MVRPRTGGFAYSEADLSVMLEDAAILLQHGAAGVAFGILCDDGRIDIERCQAMMHTIGPAESVFHRAFDLTPDPAAALEELIDLGVQRVMTSGHRPTALEGAPLIRRLIEQARGRIEVLAAGGIRPNNVRGLIAATGAREVHASLRGPRTDSSVRANPLMRFSAVTNPPEDQYDGTDQAMVAAMRAETR